jgi:hypothetical protein
MERRMLLWPIAGGLAGYAAHLLTVAAGST